MPTTPPLPTIYQHLKPVSQVLQALPIDDDVRSARVTEAAVHCQTLLNCPARSADWWQAVESMHNLICQWQGVCDDISPQAAEQQWRILCFAARPLLKSFR